MTMKSKTTMFAVMVLAAITVSIGFSPSSFATNETQVYIYMDTVQENTTRTSSTSDLHCSTNSPDRCGGYLYVDNVGYEWVKSNYYIGGGAVVCDFNAVVKINGNVVSDINFYDHETYGQWDYVSYHPDDIKSTDTFEMTLSFDNCYIDV